MAGLPDTAGFFEAQARLRQELGTDARFQVRTAIVWPPDTQLNRETGRPFDPTIKPQSGGDLQEVVVRCSTLTRLVSSNVAGATTERAAGAFRDGGIALGLPAADRPAVEDAAEVSVGGVMYRITDIRPDPNFNEVQRYIVFGEAK